MGKKPPCKFRRLDHDEKGVQNLHTLGEDREMTIIIESGPYLPNWQV